MHRPNVQILGRKIYNQETFLSNDNAPDSNFESKFISAACVLPLFYLLLVKTCWKKGLA